MAEENDLTKLHHEHYHGEKNKNYTVSHDGNDHKVKLVDIQELGPGEEGRRDAFSLIFECKDAKLDQGIYTVEHGKLGAGELLLVPLHPHEAGKEGSPEDELYEAVFA